MTRFDWLLLALACGACAHPRPRIARNKPNGWFELSGGVADLKTQREDVASDWLALGVAAGYDVIQGPPDVGFEVAVIGAAHPLHDSVIGPDDESADLDVIRFLGGARATTDLGWLPCAAYVRGGWFFRSEHDESNRGFAQDLWGTYVGGGLEFMFEPNVRFGPALIYERSEGGRPSEWIVAFSVRIYGY